MKSKQKRCAFRNCHGTKNGKPQQFRPFTFRAPAVFYGLVLFVFNGMRICIVISERYNITLQSFSNDIITFSTKCWNRHQNLTSFTVLYLPDTLLFFSFCVIVFPLFHVHSMAFYFFKMFLWLKKKKNPTRYFLFFFKQTIITKIYQFHWTYIR